MIKVTKHFTIETKPFFIIITLKLNTKKKPFHKCNGISFQPAIFFCLLLLSLMQLNRKSFIIYVWKQKMKKIHHLVNYYLWPRTLFIFLYYQSIRQFNTQLSVTWTIVKKSTNANNRNRLTIVKLKLSLHWAGIRIGRYRATNREKKTKNGTKQNRIDKQQKGSWPSLAALSHYYYIQVM